MKTKWSTTLILTLLALALLGVFTVLAAPGDFIAAWGWGVDTGAAAFEICTPASTPCQAGTAGGGNAGQPRCGGRAGRQAVCGRLL
jgi:hypothetical protein